jgi:hypothetical protein
MTVDKQNDPVENAMQMWRENELEYPNHVIEQLDDATHPGSMIEMTAMELGDLIGVAFRAGWDYADMYRTEISR